jgi:serine/threonine protein kinase
MALLSIGPGMTAIFETCPAAGLIPLTFGRYETEELIGASAMSAVYRARDPVINRLVAVKVVAQRPETSSQEYQRFLSELHLLGRLGHPNIVQVFDAGIHEGSPFIVMEYLEGENLAEAIAHNRCADYGTKLSIVRQIAAALRRVHAADVCHRDIKPANVFLESHGGVKLMDFGVSARLDAPRLTHTGALIGTLPYLAPEQIRGEELSPSVDIYAFGVVLFELFTGSKPFGGTAAETLHKIVNEPTPSVPLGGLPSGLVDLIRRCTSKRPADRPRDFDQILEALSRISIEPSAKPPEKRRRAVAIFVSAAAALTLTVVLWVARGRLAGRAVPPQNTPAPHVSLPTTPSEKTVPSALLSEVPAAPKPRTERPAQKAESQQPMRVSQSSPTAAPKQSPDERPLPVAPRKEPAIQELRRAEVPPVASAELPNAADLGRAPDGVVSDRPATIVRDTPAKQEAEVVKPVAPAAALADPAPTDRQKILDTIARYAAAQRNMNIHEIRAVRAPMSPVEAEKLNRRLSLSTVQDYRLEKESDPEVEGDKAKLRCRWTESLVSRNRGAFQKRPDVQTAKGIPVIVHLVLMQGSWKIASIERI